MDSPDRRAIALALLLSLGLAFLLAQGLTRSPPARTPRPAPWVTGLQQRHPLDEREVGQLLLTELRCGACHALPGPAVLPERPAPRLDAVGARLAPEYLARFLAEPAAVEPGTTMPDLLAGESADERARIGAALAAFLASGSAEPFVRDPVDEADAARGRKLFRSIGCLACHASPEAQAPAGDGVTLTHVASKYSLRSLEGFLFQPLEVRPSGRMPDMNLTREEAHLLASYLLDAGPARDPVPAATATAGLEDDGRRYFEQYRCASCHEWEGSLAPAAPRDLRTLTSGCLAPLPVGAPDYHLDAAQAQAMRSALAGPPAPVSDPDRVALTLTAFACIACHARDDYGGVTAAKDPFFGTSQPDLGKEARIPPHLTRVGSKLHLEWMQKVLFDAASLRPYLHTRMPQFGEANLAFLPALLERTDAGEEVSIPEPGDDARNAVRAAGTLLLGDQGLACITCHDFNGRPSPRFQGLDLIGSFERLKPGWFLSYLRAPQEYEPGTVMPTFWSEHEPTLPEVLGGDPQAQMEAIWFVLSLGTSAPDPSGIHSVSSRLTVSDTPRLYRGRSDIAGYRGIAVGFPAGLHYAFNAETGALSGLWRGDFVGVRWGGQGAGDFHPASRAVSLAQDLAIARLDDDQAPWPLLPRLDPDEPINPDPLYARDHGYRFQGYWFDDAWVPTLLYRSGDVAVEDRSVVDTSGERPVLQRTLRLSAPAAETLYLRALTGDIQRRSETRFETPDVGLTVAGVETVLRPNSADPSTLELLLKVEVPAGESTLRIDHELLR